MVSCIASYYDSEIAEYGEIAANINRAYANEIGWEYVSRHTPYDRTLHPSWQKLFMVMELIRSGRYEFVALVDADAAFNPLTTYSIHDFLPDSGQLATIGGDVKSYPLTPLGLNAGVVIFRACSDTLELLHEWVASAINIFRNGGMWEQSQLQHMLMTQPSLLQKIRYIPFNTLQAFPQTNTQALCNPFALVFHFAGTDTQTRVNGLRDIHRYRDTSRTHTRDLVVARYRESLAWLTPRIVRMFDRVIVYNKGGDFLELPDGVQVIALPNVGTEAHTYLHHVISNYDNLADLTMYCPGSAGDPEKYFRYYMCMHHILSTPTVVGMFPTHGSADAKELARFRISSYVSARGTYESLHPAAPRPFGAWFAHHIGIPDGIETSAANPMYKSIFVATKTNTIRHAKSLYSALRDTVSVAPYMEASHYMERSWLPLLR